MTQVSEATERKRRTPADATEFEREQLRFFLSGDDLAVTLATLNPSLAWFSVLSEMNLIQNERQLIAWIQGNFASLEALREVVANLAFFGPDAGAFLKSRLDAQASTLSPLLLKSWNLLIRHMRATKQGLARVEWFDLLPQLKRGEHDTIILEHLADLLRPKLRIKKPFLWREMQEAEPKTPSDLMSIEYSVDEGISSADILSSWSAQADPKTDANLLHHMTGALEAALADATEVGVESNQGYSTSDSDVPSVAKHAQNEYHSGFQAIVRVIADIWERLAKKSPTMAIPLAKQWFGSDFRLVHRIALFAAADKAVSVGLAAKMLRELPVGELFLSRVEVHRLIRERWTEFNETQQDAILSRLCEGPPRDWYREGVEGDRAIDHLRYEALSDMVRRHLRIGDPASSLLHDIQTRYPQWAPKPLEQTGFRVWRESGFRDTAADPGDLANVPDEMLVAEARRIGAKAGFMDGDKWQGLVLKEPDRALRGLAFAAEDDDWPASFWEQLLWSRTPYVDESTERRVAELLAGCPVESLATFAPAATLWLDERARTLSDHLLWPLWDRLTEAALIVPQEPADA